MPLCEKLAVFDLDGTISQTHLFSVPAHKQVMADMGYPVKTEDEIIRTYGMVQKDYLTALIGDYESEKAMTYIRRVAALENEFILTRGKPYEGTAEMLRSLRADGIKTAICSNASYRYISMVLAAYGLGDLIDFIQPVSTGLSKVDTLGILIANSGARKTVMCGDTAFDMQAAQGNGIPFVGCMYGFQPWQLEKAAYKAENMPQLCEIIKTILN
ncbi:MAG: HAD hydrolase-like protein [Clostridia bacterium]|nr:HAD hydrolase-like protein [Clostridia bacterium]